MMHMVVIYLGDDMELLSAAYSQPMESLRAAPGSDYAMYQDRLWETQRVSLLFLGPEVYGIDVEGWFWRVTSAWDYVAEDGMEVTLVVLHHSESGRQTYAVLFDAGFYVQIDTYLYRRASTLPMTR